MDVWWFVLNSLEKYPKDFLRFKDYTAWFCTIPFLSRCFLTSELIHSDWKCSNESPLLQTGYAKQRRNAISTTSNKLGLRSCENYTLERFSFILEKAALSRTSLISSRDPLPHVISSSNVPQKAEILLSGYLQWVNLSPIFLFSSILTFFLYMKFITDSPVPLTAFLPGCFVYYAAWA